MRIIGYKLPWYMIVDSTGTMITSPTIPVKINDTKAIIFAESQVPGLNYTPLYPARFGNRKIAFSLPIINRLARYGNQTTLDQIELLRNSDNPSILSLFQRPARFKANPTVIYGWGTHTTPLRWVVRKADMEHNSSLTNANGFSQYTIVNLELEVDEDSTLYRAYRIKKLVSSIAGNFVNSKQLNSSGRPY